MAPSCGAASSSRVFVAAWGRRRIDDPLPPPAAQREIGAERPLRHQIQRFGPTIEFSDIDGLWSGPHDDLLAIRNGRQANRCHRKALGGPGAWRDGGQRRFNGKGKVVNQRGIGTRFQRPIFGRCSPRMLGHFSTLLSKHPYEEGAPLPAER
ncbi:hypothetical protein [Aliidongia sp.]|uniref:hypothetical protein n=1 Tax=Aliidongia sp. TaxID=1914230 RepID=UPI002DDCC3DC|nr:hypothetical protein [Aliidongia sp.]